MFGVRDQVSMCMGECGELIAALNRVFTQGRKEEMGALADEIADVEIMLGQMRRLVPSEMIEQRRRAKLQRLADILSGEVVHPHAHAHEKTPPRRGCELRVRPYFPRGHREHRQQRGCCDKRFEIELRW